MKKKYDNPRKPVQIFLEEDLVSIARSLSKKYTRMGKPVCGKRDGSASWYIRNALLERMRREGVKLDIVGLTDCDIYEIRR